MRKLLLVMSLFITSIVVAAPGAVADTGAESTGADQLSGNVTPAMVAASSIVHCTGYVTLASLSANGHRLSTKANTCGVYYGRLGSFYGWGPVVRYKCYRDGVQFGAGTGGCRWKGTLSMYKNGSPYLHEAFALPGTLSGAFWDDSGREYGSAKWFSSSDSLRMCEDDYLWDAHGSAAGNGVVHFMGATGIDYGTFNMADWCTVAFPASDTS